MNKFAIRDRCRGLMLTKLSMFRLHLWEASSGVVLPALRTTIIIIIHNTGRESLNQFIKININK